METHDRAKFGECIRFGINSLCLHLAEYSLIQIKPAEKFKSHCSRRTRCGLELQPILDLRDVAHIVDSTGRCSLDRPEGR